MSKFILIIKLSLKNFQESCFRYLFKINNVPTFYFIIKILEILKFTKFKVSKLNSSFILSKYNNYLNNILRAQPVIQDKSNKISGDIYHNKTNVSLGIFVLKNNDVNLTYEIFSDLFQSFQKHIAPYVVLDEFGSVLSASSKYLESLNFRNIEEISSFDKVLIFFEANSTKFNYVQFLHKSKKPNLKFIIICFDLWRDFDFQRIQSWRNHKDVTFLHMDDSLTKIDGFDMQKFYNWIYVGFHEKLPHTQKKRSFFWSGGAKSHERKIWLLYFKYLACKFKIKSEVLIVNYQKPKTRISRTQYLENLASNQYCFSLTAKSADKTLTTFRAIEILSLGSTLVHQEFHNHHPLREKFVPFLHYLPFQSIEELAIIFKLISERSELLEKISLQAFNYWNSNFSAAKRWHDLIMKVSE